MSGLTIIMVKIHQGTCHLLQIQTITQKAKMAITVTEIQPLLKMGTATTRVYTEKGMKSYDFMPFFVCCLFFCCQYHLIQQNCCSNTSNPSRYRSYHRNLFRYIIVVYISAQFSILCHSNPYIYYN